MVLLFQILSLLLAVGAAFFYSRDNWDWAFAAGAAAICSLFLSMRYRIKQRLSDENAESSKTADEHSD